MSKWIHRLILVGVMFMGGYVSAQTPQTVTGTILGSNGSACPGGLTGTQCFARFRLRNFQGYVPRVVGVGVIAPTQVDVIPNSSGVFSSTFYTNDVIQPLNCGVAGNQSCTFYTVEYWYGGKELASANYVFSGAGPFNLLTQAPMTTAVPPSIPFQPMLLNPIGTQIVSGFGVTFPWLTTQQYVDFAFISPPANPASGFCRLYFNNASLVGLNSSGGSCANTSGGGGGGTVTGSGTTNFIPVWTSSSALGNSDLQYVAGTPGSYTSASNWTITDAPTVASNPNYVFSATNNTKFTGSGTVSLLGVFLSATDQSGSSSTATLQTLTGVTIQALGNPGAGETAAMTTLTGASIFTQAPFTANVTNQYGLLIINTGQNNANTVANRYGINIGSNTPGSVITNDYGLYVQSPAITAATSINHKYGVYVADQTLVGSGANSDPWGIWVNGGKSVFKGGIGTGGASNTDMAGQCTLGTNCVITFTNTYISAPICSATDTTAANAIRVVVNTTTATFTGTGTDVLDYICIARN